MLQAAALPQPSRVFTRCTQTHTSHLLLAARQRPHSRLHGLPLQRQESSRRHPAPTRAQSQQPRGAGQLPADLSPEVDPSQTPVMAATVASPQFLLAALVLFSIVAWDARGPGPRLLPQYVDAPAHQWVRSSLPDGVRAVVGEKLISDLFISSGIFGWVFTLSATVAREPVPAIKRGALCLAVYFFGGGSISGTDPFLVDRLKAFFHRARPTELNHTLSFPSGHTTAATFIMGTLLVVLLPALTTPGGPPTSSVRERFGRSLQRVALPLWAGAVVTTATGRVLGDVHWVSDTMAGACLGAALTSATAMACNAINKRDHFK